MSLYNLLKEGKSLLQDAEIDSDAKTRNQSKTIKELTKEPAEEEVPKKKAKLAKNMTMAATAEVSRVFKIDFSSNYIFL